MWTTKLAVSVVYYWRHITGSPNALFQIALFTSWYFCEVRPRLRRPAEHFFSHCLLFLLFPLVDVNSAGVFHCIFTDLYWPFRYKILVVSSPSLSSCRVDERSRGDLSLILIGSQPLSVEVQTHGWRNQRSPNAKNIQTPTLLLWRTAHESLIWLFPPHLIGRHICRHCTSVGCNTVRVKINQKRYFLFFLLRTRAFENASIRGFLCAPRNFF